MKSEIQERTEQRARRLTKWYRIIEAKLREQPVVSEDQRVAVGVHLNDLKQACGRIERLIEAMLRADPEDPEELLDVLIELQIEAEHARYHINELLPILEAVIDALPLEDDEE